MQQERRPDAEGGTREEGANSPGESRPDTEVAPPTCPESPGAVAPKRWYAWWVYERVLRPRLLITVQWVGVVVALIVGRVIDASGWAFLTAVALIVMPSTFACWWVAWALPPPAPLAEHSLAGATIVRAARIVWGSVILLVGAVVGAMLGTSYQWLIDDDPGSAASRLLDSVVPLTGWAIAVVAVLAFLTLMVRIGRTDTSVRARAAGRRKVPFLERPADELWSRWMSGLVHVWTTAVGLPLLITVMVFTVTAQ